jgi:hypothetical protein
MLDDWPLGRAPWLADQATIRVETITVLNRRILTFFWEGPRTATVLVSMDLWEEVKEQLPWKVRIVGKDERRYAFIIARADGPYFFSWLYHTAKAHLWNWTAGFKARLVMTLVVWNLAYVPDGEIPGWRHVGKREVPR